MVPHEPPRYADGCERMSEMFYPEATVKDPHIRSDTGTRMPFVEQYDFFRLKRRVGWDTVLAFPAGEKYIAFYSDDVFTVSLALADVIREHAEEVFVGTDYVEALVLPGRLLHANLNRLTETVRVCLVTLPPNPDNGENNADA
jgi:hypothetical protein